MELSPTSAKKDTSNSNVLTNGDLLQKILLRFGCPRSLVSAALTSKRWLHGASKQVGHPPGLLGIYVSSAGITSSEFIPLLQLDASSPEASAILADFGFGNLPTPNVWDCRNGVVLFEFGGDGETFHHGGLAVRSPLLYPDMDKPTVLPQAPQLPTFSEYPHAMLLPADHGDGALCYRVDVRTNESKNMVTVVVCVLRSDSWAVHCIAMGCLAKSPIQILPTTVLVGGKIYMATQAGYILGLDLGKEEFFIVDLPKGMELDQYPGNLVHGRGDDSVLYLCHVDRKNRLNVWLRKMKDDHEHDDASTGSGSANNGWVLRDTISVRETCGHLMEQEGLETIGDGDEDADVVTVVGAGDNAEFVFLELGVTGIIVCMHLKTREVKQVYQREPDDDYLISVRPFMFVRPPILPVQDAHEGEATPQQE
ncbi:hypothetical protein BDA96_04G097800 [Sorghum bicolor]|uniref:F-box protein AT5G49610-like beta-propeller domain-containing protein n=1 Tax=Sorghum bicolor TaxID=4558 RepID=A0A921UHZ7_SORBI|nr:hypothetical protein BDA96_04G097800 [Sorghum bicolor]